MTVSSGIKKSKARKPKPGHPWDRSIKRDLEVMRMQKRLKEEGKLKPRLTPNF